MLDLFCGAGGAAQGYMNAGFRVTGVDYRPQPRYAGNEFVYADAFEYVLEHGSRFDVIHASPPCQKYSTLAGRTGLSYPDSIAHTRELLAHVGKPWVIENVPDAPLIDPIMLCGTHFDLQAAGRYLRRHRHFESPLHLYPLDSTCYCDGLPIGGVYGDGGGGQQKRGFRFTAQQAQVAMEIDWMTRRELSQAIPPAFTTFIGFQLKRLL